MHMKQNAIFREMALTCLITNFSPEGGFERIWLSTGRKPDATACNRLRNAIKEDQPPRSSWNGKPVTALI
jgi:hypothetical protein